MPEENTEAVIRRTEGDDWLNVEIDDLTCRAESGVSNPLPKEKRYGAVEFLSNGWVRCIRPDTIEDADKYEDESVDYYPPQRINGVFTVEEDEIS
jgi:hypothetical protein